MSTSLAVDEVLIGTESIFRLADGAVEFKSADAGDLTKRLRGDNGLNDLFRALKAQFGVVSIAAIIAVDTLTHPQSSQITVTATYTGGATRNVTSLCTFATSDATKATVDTAGLVTSVAAGAVNITATYLGRLTSVEGVTVA